MKVVIDIPDYNLDEVQNGSIACGMILNAVKNGTVLPKGHGDLIDRKALSKALKSGCEICGDINTNWCERCCPHNVFEDLIDEAAIVIEADKEKTDVTDTEK